MALYTGLEPRVYPGFMTGFLSIGLSPFFTPGPGPLLTHTAYLLVHFWAALQRKVTSSSLEETAEQNSSLLGSLQI